MVPTIGYSTSLAKKTKTLATLVAQQKLQLGDGIDGVTIAPTRRRERMLEGGRSRGKRVGVKLERVGSDYNPREDSCIKAFVRLMAQVAQDHEEEA